jgi:tetratricopeptide (TPR) repeat protein
MWFSILLGLVGLIFVLGILNISVGVNHRKIGGFVIKGEGLLLAIIVFLVITSIQCTKEKKPGTEGEGETSSEQLTAGQRWKNNLLAQLQIYLGDITKTDKAQLLYYLEQGDQYRKKREYAEALDLYEQALSLEISDGERLPFFVLMGNCEAHLSEYTTAINYYFQAERISKETQKDSALAVVYSNLALVYRLADDPDAALESYHNLLGTVRKLKDISGEKNALANIGFIYQTRGETDSASYYHQKSLEIPAPLTGFMAEAAQLNNLAMACKSKGMPDSALVLYEKALQLFQRMGNRWDEASVLVNIGIIYQDKNDLAKAQEYYQNAFVIDSTIGNIMGQGGDLNNLGSVSEQGGDLTAAKQFYQRSLSFFEQMAAKGEIEFVRRNVQRVDSLLAK